jgi:hypothetical protein
MFGEWTRTVPQNVARWIALYAAHEKRRTFQPTFLHPDSRGGSMFLPGAHGDVGGQGGDPHCSALALHRMVRGRILAGGDSALAPHPLEPDAIEPSGVIRLLPAMPRDVEAFKAKGARVHPWVRKVAA